MTGPKLSAEVRAWREANKTRLNTAQKQALDLSAQTLEKNGDPVVEVPVPEPTSPGRWIETPAGILLNLLTFDLVSPPSVERPDTITLRRLPSSPIELRYPSAAEADAVWQTIAALLR